MKHITNLLLATCSLFSMEQTQYTPSTALQFKPYNEQDLSRSEELYTSLTKFYEYLKQPEDHELLSLIPHDPDGTLLTFIENNRPLITLYGYEDRLLKDKSKMIEATSILTKPTSKIDEINLDNKTIKYTLWEKEKNQAYSINNKTIHSIKLLGDTQGSAICMRDATYGFYIGCHDGSLQRLDGAFKKIYALNKIHQKPISHIKVLNKRMFLTRSLQEQECYIWNTYGEPRPHVRLETIPSSSHIYTTMNGRDLELICSHAGSKSRVSASFDNDKIYTIPHFWTSGENVSNFDLVRALYVFGLSQLAKTNIHDNITEDFSIPEALVAFKKSAIIKTFEKEVTLAFDKFLDEKEIQLKQAKN